MRCPLCGKRLIQEGIERAKNDFGEDEPYGVDVQFVCEDGHSGWMTVVLEEEIFGERRKP
jgi:hypothetical protein